MARAGFTDPVTREVAYSDLNLKFTAHPATGRLTVLKNNDAVNRAVKNLIMTKKFERPYAPLYGSDVYSSLFEQIDTIADDNVSVNITAANVKKDIEAAIKNYEPRAEVLEVTVKADSERNGLDVTIYYIVANQANPTSLEIFLERLR